MDQPIRAVVRYLIRRRPRPAAAGARPPPRRPLRSSQTRTLASPESLQPYLVALFG